MGQTVTVILSDTNGLLSQTANQGTVKGSGTTSLSLTGTVAQVNADLATLSITDGTIPNDTITITSGDSRTGNGAPVTINVSVNAPPVITVGGAQILSQGVAKAVPGVSIADPDALGAGETLTVTVSDTVGLLTATGTGVSGSGTTSLTITGSVAQINAALATLMDTEGASGTDTITVTAGDGRGGTAVPGNIALTISGVPTLSGPASLVVGQGQSVTVPGLNLTEKNTTKGESFTVTVSDLTGILTDAGTGVTGSGTKSLTMTGTLAQVVADLAILKVSEASGGADTITLSATDTNGGAATPVHIAVTSNGPPVVTAPASLVTGQNKAVPIATVKLSESGNTVGETFTVKVTDKSGLLSATGTGISGSGTTSLTITGTLAQVNADLATLAVSEAAAGNDTITLTPTDSLGGSGTPVTVAVTTNGLPIVTAPSSLIIGAGKTVPFMVTLTETGNTAGETFTVTLTDATGLLSATGTGITGSGTNSLTITGSLALVVKDLKTLTDTSSTPGTDTITITSSDSLGDSGVTQFIAVTTNGLPVIAAPPSAAVTTGKAMAILGVSLSETGNTTGETFTDVLTDTNGLLTANGKGITGSGTTTLTITGSLSQVNADLATLKDTEAAGGADTIHLTATDSFGNAATPANILVTASPSAPSAFVAAMAGLAGGGASALIASQTLAATWRPTILASSSH